METQKTLSNLPVVEKKGPWRREGGDLDSSPDLGDFTPSLS